MVSSAGGSSPAGAYEDAVGRVEDPEADATTETSPLLRRPMNGNGNGNGHDKSITTATVGHPSGNEPTDGAVQTTSPGPPAANGGQQEERVILPHAISSTRLWVILCTAWVGVFLGAVDATIIATLSAPISSEFHSLSLLSWLATAYLIANAACQPVSGRLTDIFGRGPGLIFSNVFFAAGNLICGLARSEGAMLAGRVVAGIGGGGLMSISTFLASDLVPLRRRGLIQGIGNICYGTGAMLGGVFGGFVNDSTAWGWRLAFLAQVPPVLVSAVLVWFLVDIPPKQSDKSYLSRIDFSGVFLTIAFLVLLLLGLNSGGNVVPWTHPLPLVSLSLSLVAFLAFVYCESRASQPIIPVRLLVNRTILAACIANLVCTMVVLTGVFYVPLYYQVLGHSASQAGLYLLFSPLGVSFASVGTGLIMKRTGRYFVLGVSVVAVFLLGTFLLTRLSATSPVWLGPVALLCTGSGYGAMLTVTLLACIAAVDHAHQAVVTSATYAFRSVGATSGIAIAGAIYQNVLKRELWERLGHLPGAAEEIARIRDDLGELGNLPPGWDKGQVVEAFMEAFGGVWWLMFGLAAAGLVCMACMKEYTLHATLERR